MKVLILAGGKGTRLAEETVVRPKPMVEIGGKPIIWHIMKTYSTYGFDDFVIALGYLGQVIKEYFYLYSLFGSDVTVDLGNRSVVYEQRPPERWRVTLVDTGDETGTAQRIVRAAPYLSDTFMMTYGDGLADVNIRALIQRHSFMGRPVTMTVVQPDGKLGAVNIGHDGLVESFREKPPVDGWVNGGFFVMDKAPLLSAIGAEEYLEGPTLAKLATDHMLTAYKHTGFWQCMDTMREKQILERMWNSGNAPWKIW